MKNTIPVGPSRFAAAKMWTNRREAGGNRDKRRRP